MRALEVRHAPILDLFAGPGGWDEGLRMLGISDVLGVEWEANACATAEAAGHRRLQADVAALDPFLFAPITGLIASPPCQAWSMAGNRRGEMDRDSCHWLADKMAEGVDVILTDRGTPVVWEDDRSPLVCQPVRWVRDLRPEWVALEEVPAVASLWEHFARIFTAWGYSVWTGDLCAADFGVPQTRTRRVLIASRVRKVGPPRPTHSAQGGDLFGTPSWVSMADALGIDPADVVGFPRRADTESNRAGDVVTIAGADYRARDLFEASGPSHTVTEKARSWRRWLRCGNQANSPVRGPHEPAPTLLFGHRSNDVSWYPSRPAARPGESMPAADRRAVDAVRVSVSEAGVLQTFPANYPWQGSRSKQYLQVGNAVPPLFAAHVLAAAIGCEAPA